jgi:hypothetical protein
MTISLHVRKQQAAEALPTCKLAVDRQELKFYGDSTHRLHKRMCLSVCAGESPVKWAGIKHFFVTYMQ